MFETTFFHIFGVAIFFCLNGRPAYNREQRTDDLQTDALNLDNSRTDSYDTRMDSYDTRMRSYQFVCYTLYKMENRGDSVYLAPPF